MNSKILMSNIEALLFVVGDNGLTVQQLAGLLEVGEADIEAGLSELQTSYEASERGIMLKKLAGTYQLITKPQLADTIKKLVENPSSHILTTASLEVLAIIAYKQPITRTEVEDLRGVKSERPIQTLLSRALIQEVGRAEGTGRAILYGTTKEFLNYFGLQSVSDLPPVPTDEQVDDDHDTDLFMTKFQEVFDESQ